MPYRLEVGLKPDLFDAEGHGLRQKAREYFGLDIDSVRSFSVLTFDLSPSQEQLERIRTEIFTNPVTQISSYKPLAADFDWVMWVGLRPGVRDNPGATAREAVEDLLGFRFQPGDDIYTSKLYAVRGNLSRAQAEKITRELLANAIIQQWKLFSKQEWNPETGIGIIIPKVRLDHEPKVTAIPIRSDDELRRISDERNLALNPRDIPTIRAYFLNPSVLEARERVGLAEPTDVEIEYISQARSDHCNHNTFHGLFRYVDRGTSERCVVDDLFKTCIQRPTVEIQQQKPWVISVLWDNAGVARLDEDHYYVITGETHNSPSNMEAYGGALTGIVGVYRDPMGTGLGSKLIAGMYGYCVGHRTTGVSSNPICTHGASWMVSSRVCGTAETKAAYLLRLEVSTFMTGSSGSVSFSLRHWDSCRPEWTNDPPRRKRRHPGNSSSWWAAASAKTASME